MGPCDLDGDGSIGKGWLRDGYRSRRSAFR